MGQDLGSCNDYGMAKLINCELRDRLGQRGGNVDCNDCGKANAKERRGGRGGRLEIPG